MGRKNYVLGTFTLSNEHIELSEIAGVNEKDLIEEFLVNLEMDLRLVPGCLILYYAEQLKEYRKYWYTEGKNTSYIISFERKLYSFDKNFHVINN